MSAVQQKRLFPNEDVTYEYHPGLYIKLRVSGFVISVYKPLSRETYKGSKKYYTEPKIDISTNATVCINIQNKILIDRSIEAAIEILNREPDDRKIDIHNWKNNYETVALDKPLATPVKTKTILPKPNQLFEASNGVRHIYLGYGYLFRLNNGLLNADCLRMGHIYLQPTTYSNIRIAYNALIIDKASSLDAFISEKRAIKILKNYGNTFENIVIEYPNGRSVYNVSLLDKKAHLDYSERNRIAHYMNENRMLLNKLNNYLTMDL